WPPPAGVRGGAPTTLRSGPYKEPAPLTRWQLIQLPLLLSKIDFPLAASPALPDVPCAYSGTIVIPAARTMLKTRSGLRCLPPLIKGFGHLNTTFRGRPCTRQGALGLRAVGHI